MDELDRQNQRAEDDGTNPQSNQRHGDLRSGLRGAGWEGEWQLRNSSADKRRHSNLAARLLYQANPFYLISAALFLYGLTVLFNTDDTWIDTAIPFGLLATYTVLMAGTAVFIVRRGHVWDDARSIVLVVLLLFMALSVGLDTKILENPGIAPVLLLGAFGFAAAVSEGLLRGLRLRLPAVFRCPYYAILGLFFLYPYVLVQLVAPGQETATVRGIALFPALGAIAFLALVPAVRRGADSVRGNETPWRWPWFPWTVFATLFLGVCARTYMMCVSFYPGDGFGTYGEMTTGFGVYMLAPLAVAALVLFLEHGIATRNLPFQWTVIASSMGLYLLATPSLFRQSRIYYRFMTAILGESGTPLLLMVILVTAFCVYAWLRRVRGAEFAVLASLVLGSLVNMRTSAVSVTGVPNTLPFFVITLLLFWLAAQFQRSWIAFAAVLCGVATLCVQFRGTWFTAWHGVIPLHLLYVGVLIIGALGRDLFARVLEYLAALVQPVLFVTALFFARSLVPDVPTWLLAGYLACLTAVAVAGFFWLPNDLYLYATASNGAFCVLHAGIASYRAIAGLNSPGLTALVWATMCFLVALLISLIKGGVIRDMGTGAAHALRVLRRWQVAGPAPIPDANEPSDR